MMSAAAMGAVAFQKGLGAIHSLSAIRSARLRHPPRHHECRGDADGAGLQPRRHRRTGSTPPPPIWAFKGGFEGFRAGSWTLRGELNIPET
jgi:hypothetical protein